MKKIKNVVLIILMVVSVLGIVLTISYGKNNITSSSTNSNREINGEMPSGTMPGDMARSDSDDETDIDSDMMVDSSSEEKADGDFAGAGEDETSNTTSITLTTPYIIVIGVFTLIFVLSFIYLISSKFNSKNPFKNSDKVVLYILESIVLCGIITFILVYVTNNYVYKSSSSSSSVSYSSTDDLHIDNANWSYDSSNNVYYQIGIVYVSDPETVEYESMGIYIPGDYLDCSKNSDDTYTCSIDEQAEVNGYTASTAPIVMPVNTAGYSAQRGPTSYSYSGLGDYLDAGFIYVYAGCRGRNNGDDYSGGAPWGVTDLKAAVRYLRYNSDSLPGNIDSIFAFGHSGGGAQSTILGASGDSELYTDYLESIGALMYDDDGNYISDAIAGVMAWCPITSLDYASEAYEWNMGQYSTSGSRSSSSWTNALSLDLAEAYAEYINALKLVDDGNTLTLSSTDTGVYTSGTYYYYLLGVIENSLNNYLSDNYTSLSDMENYVSTLNSDTKWVTFDEDTKTVSISSIEEFVNHCKSASKDVGAFDDLNRSQAENYVFGNDDNDALHFDITMANLLKDKASIYSAYSDYEDYSSEYESDLEEVDKLGNNYEYRMNMYNPMYYLTDYYEGYETSTVSKYWRIRTGITQGDTALTVEVNLALALENYDDVESVDFETVWNQGHTTAERTGDSTENFIDWVNECVK